jgi:hypothetical protein
VPLMELLDRSRTSRFVALHIDMGMLPYNLLLERNKNPVLGRDRLKLAGMEEWKLLPDKSKYSTYEIIGTCPWS